MKSLIRFLFGKFLGVIFSNDPKRVGQFVLNGRHQFVWLSEHVGRKIALRIFERNETRYFTHAIKQGDVCFDIGANVGYFTHLFASRTGATGRVVAVEPVRKNILLIELASELNGSDSIIAVVNAAVSSKAGSISLDTTDDSSYASVHVDHVSETKTIRAITIDSLIFELNLVRIDILKMDIEGWEYHALEGMQQVLSDRSRRPRLMMIELYSDHLKRYGSSIQQICDYLASYGYQPFVLDKRCDLIPFEPHHQNSIYNVFFTDTEGA
ncbi:MAG TPA: FkbM family methyltransferase [Nitrospirota bacterium]|nr:FkbM family methyltransferase [Nitrospirota bacterium]